MALQRLTGQVSRPPPHSHLWAMLPPLQRNTWGLWPEDSRRSRHCVREGCRAQACLWLQFSSWWQHPGQWVSPSSCLSASCQVACAQVFPTLYLQTPFPLHTIFCSLALMGLGTHSIAVTFWALEWEDLYLSLCSIYLTRQSAWPITL